MGVYALVVIGATAALTDAVRACGGWPVCGGTLTDPAVLIGTGHRALAAFVGGLLLVTAYFVWQSTVRPRVRWVLGFALVLYPAQIVVGALVATSIGSPYLPGIHLAIGVGLFGALVLALAWNLETETGRDDISGSWDPPGRHDSTAPESWGDKRLSRVWAYVRLMKPRLMWLLCLVAAAGMAIAAGPSLRPRTVVLTLVGGVLAIGASGTFNNVFERDRDQRMARTADRPVATQQVPPGRAIAFGLTLAALAVLLFWQVNPLVAALGVVAILFYSVVYTLVLKPHTVQNTVIGGAAGALPAVIGAAAATGEIEVAGLALAGLIFVWTPAHFYNLALAYQDDYAKGGFPMMPVVRGETTTRKHILLWLAATLGAAAVLLWVTDLSWLAAAATVTLGGVFLWAVVRLHREQSDRAAMRAFHASNAYLGIVLLAAVIDALAI